MKHLLIVYHSQSGNTRTMADAIYCGATSEDVEGVETKLLMAQEAGLEELLWANALVLGTPENFGYMSGALKDFLDRTYYPAQGKVDGLPYTIFISAGNDGTGALNAIQRIARGYPLREVQDAVVARGELTAQDIERCEELGMAMAAGLELGVF
jgi:multimeric flavodoxin WrbA